MTHLAGPVSPTDRRPPGPARGGVGLNFVPRSVALAVEVARVAEDHGFESLGFADSPASYAEVYATLTAAALATSRVALGPYVTNPVTRHWSVHAAALRTLREVAGDRVFAAFGAGDSAVRSFGLPAAGPAEVEHTVTQVRSALAGTVPVQVAADGPRMAEVAGRCADAVILGCGDDEAALAALVDTAQAAAARASRPVPGVWVALPARVVTDAAEVPAARRDVLPVVAACANHSLHSRWARESVPDRLRGPLRAALARYDMSAHARVSEPDGNGSLFADDPDLEEYLLRRFALVGTPADCQARMDRILSLPGVTGVRLSTTAADPIRNIGAAAPLAGRP